jgi:phosphohistidine phosphatase SixA
MARQTNVELVVTSPMARAIQTANLAFAHVARQVRFPRARADGRAAAG